MGRIAALLILAVLAACQHRPLSTVVLLPDADGKVGSVVVRSSNREGVLAAPLSSATVDNRGAIQIGQQDDSALRQQYVAALEARPPRPLSFTVYFEFGSAVTLNPASRPVLEQLRAYLQGHPAPEITVIGHTDRVGTMQVNDALSRQRAETVRVFLVEAGIAASRMDVAGRGEREPLVPTADEMAEERNRRVEINVR